MLKFIRNFSVANYYLRSVVFTLLKVWLPNSHDDAIKNTLVLM